MEIISKDRHEQVSTALWAKFNTYSTDRYQLEQQWLRNLRQYKRIYDPEITIPEGKSRVYPGDTHTKITGWVAKMMEMMFPAQEKNWELKPTPFPNILQADLDNIIAALEAEQQVIAEQTQQEPQPVTSEQIEKAVKAFAEQRARRMEQECEDQLTDESIDYPELCKKVIRRGGIYGFGVAEGPQVRTQAERVWEPDPMTGQFVAVTKKLRRPFYTPLRAWDVYPDLSAPTWSEQEGLFTRKAFTRHGLVLLSKRDDFFGAEIREYLKEAPTGDYKPRSYEAELDVIRKMEQTGGTVKGRLYDVIRWYGFLSGKDLSDLGVDVSDALVSKDVLADVWLLGGRIIKADTAPFGEKVSDMFHVYIPEEDEDGPLTGSAKVEVLRDSQMKLCATDRALMDNMAESASSIKEINNDLIDINRRPSRIVGGMTIHRNGDGAEANYPAIRIYDVPNHTQQLLALRSNILEVFDAESNLPSWRMGNAQPLGEAFRTSNNMSLMAGGGDMVTKDDVRSFDRFVKSMIGSLVRWNMEFSERDDIKGDFQVQAKGSISLVAKEVRGAALDQLVSTLSPRERVMIDERGLLEDRFKARDLPLDRIKDQDEAQQALDQFDQQQAQAAQIQQALDQSKTQLQTATAQEKEAKANETANMIEVKVQEALSRIAQNMAKAKGMKDDAALKSIQLLLSQGEPEKEGGGTSQPVEGETSQQPGGESAV